jgi:carboxypeptidase Q
MEHFMLRLCILATLLCLVGPLAAQEKVDWEMMTRIRLEATANSKVMETLGHLTDKIGPRLTGSPALKQANEYTRQTLESWGLTNAQLQAYPFGRGWSYSKCSVQLEAPRATQLLALPKAWTPATNGPVTGDAVLAVLDTEADLEKFKGKLAGKIVFLDKTREYEPKKEGFKRYDDHGLDDLCTYEYDEETERRADTRGNPSERENRFARMGLFRKINPFLREEGVLATVSISSRDDGIIRVMGGGSSDEGGEVGVPSLVMAAEYYNLVVRKLAAGEEVRLKVEVEAQFHDDDKMAYNTIAEIPGTDPKLKHEIVMIGAHLDSWHGGTGAIDNGAGVAVTMEAMRILKAIGAQPRRTIRIGLWTGEEQGLMGSRAYVMEHFAEMKMPEGLDPNIPEFIRMRRGTPVPKKDHANFSAYYNLDNGSGKIRGIYTQQNAAVAPIFQEWLKPFADMGATTVTINNTGGTDHQAFDRVGLPGFQFIQDPLDYSPKNHHTNLDVLDHVQPADLKQASAVMAGFLYQTAQRDQKLPRKPMPTPQPAGPGQRGNR